METSIYNFKAKFNRKISTTDKNFISALAKFYRGDILIPQKSCEQTIISLNKKYNVTMQLIDENQLDSYTKDITKQLLYNDHIIWRVINDKYSGIFYKEFWEKYYEVEGKPEICIVYDKIDDKFYSNCRELELLLIIEMGINDIHCDEYNNYLNSLYLFNEWLDKASSQTTSIADPSGIP
ncbi:hypothetical protein [Pseudobutyrivibrio xylanivorans]|uniref:Uncharacterized protein n=1 Tax=Pseudobutyrivibrio xylanivorans TaxID=185007 RepID=A0A1G5RQ71_PSEXY|nr:hypothetical protein [Pseudobutyrivibrio xylanivorans]SCZ76263.1 hypothetical protein SAMN02910350_00163 [Pseudobutyrivibrio xylanivorans]